MCNFFFYIVNQESVKIHIRQEIIVENQYCSIMKRVFIYYFSLVEIGAFKIMARPITDHLKCKIFDS